MKGSKLLLVLCLTLVALLLGCPAAALADGSFRINITDPDHPDGDQYYEAGLAKNTLSVPRVSFGDEKVLGTMRITGKTGVETAISEGDKVKVTLPVGSNYMRTPTSENYRRYVSWPAEVNGAKNQVCDDGSVPGIRLVEGTPQSITVEIGHLDQSGKTMAIDFVFDQVGYSTVRVSRLLDSAAVLGSDPDARVTRMEFFLLLDDITRSIPSCPIKWVDSGPDLAQCFSDLDGASPSELDRIKPLVYSGIIQGYPGGKLRPNEYITRAEAANLVGKILPERDDLTSLDDTLPVWGTGLKNAVHQGIAQGYPDGTFKPGQPITGREALILLQKTLDSYQVQD